MAAAALGVGGGARAEETLFLLGTDRLGRDYLSRVIFGIRNSLWVALFVAALVGVLGSSRRSG